MMKRKAGWYWVKQVDHPNPGYWEVAFWAGSFWEFHEQYPVVGPRIPTPDEPWQCVPVNPDKVMNLAGREYTHAVAHMWDDMLAAAPKPEDE